MDTWLEHILQKRVKLGKPKQNFKLPEGSEPADYVKKFHKINAIKKWTNANGPSPIGFVPTPDSFYSPHNSRINNPHSTNYNNSQSSISDDDVYYYYDPISIVTPAPAIIVCDLCIHVNIRLNKTKLFFVFVSDFIL